MLKDISENLTTLYENITTVLKLLELIVRTYNHVLYVSTVSRLARPDIFSLSAQIEKKFWPS